MPGSAGEETGLGGAGRNVAHRRVDAEGTARLDDSFDCREVGDDLPQILERAHRQQQVTQASGDDLGWEVGMAGRCREAEGLESFGGVDFGPEGRWLLEH
ncbi:MAG: hypothetical protein M3071_04565 [Actinomycetota bacterium]|nr:hypothetical protein [Actinomycetota bacterium]